MTRNKIMMLAVAVGSMLPVVGCDNFASNVWTGFGEAIGAVPAALVVDALLPILGL